MSILSRFLMPSLRIVGIPDIMKKFVWLAALTVALCATVASCGDDEPDNGGNVTASAEVSDFGGERLMSIDEGIDYSYNSDGTLRQVKGFGLNQIFDYRKGIILYSEGGKDQKVTFTTNSKGYITGLSSSSSEKDGYVTYNYTVSYEFEYNGADHLTYASVNQVNTDTDSQKLDEISMSWKFYWNGDLLSKVEIAVQSTGIEGDDQLNYTNNFSYDESVENRYMQYTMGVVENTDLTGVVQIAMYAGLFGKGPSKYPTRVYGSNEINFDYMINSKGLVETETLMYDGDDFSIPIDYTYGSSTKANPRNAGSASRRVKFHRADSRNNSLLIRSTK